MMELVGGGGDEVLGQVREGLVREGCSGFRTIGIYIIM